MRSLTNGRSAGLTTFLSEGTVLGVHLRPYRRHRAWPPQCSSTPSSSPETRVHPRCARPHPATIALYERLGFTFDRSQQDHWYHLPFSDPR